VFLVQGRLKSQDQNIPGEDDSEQEVIAKRATRDAGPLGEHFLYSASQHFFKCLNPLFNYTLVGLSMRTGKNNMSVVRWRRVDPFTLTFLLNISYLYCFVWLGLYTAHLLFLYFFIIHLLLILFLFCLIVVF